MYPNRLGCCDHRCSISVGFKSTNVFCDRAGHQLDVLRQIADVTAKRIGRPLIESGTVKAHVAAHRLPDADEHTHQRRFAEPLGPMMPRPCPASSSNVTSWTTILATPGGAPLKVSTVSR